MNPNKQLNDQQKQSNNNNNNLLSVNPPLKNPINNKAGQTGKSHHMFIKVMNQHKPSDGNLQITLQELQKHKNKQSAWVSLYGVVYDVTVYLSYHPGGQILLQGCGKQCSPLFNQYHPWVNAKYLLEKYKLGHLKI